LGKLEALSCKTLEKFIHGILSKIPINQGFVKHWLIGSGSGMFRFFKAFKGECFFGAIE
jgi:hypothetical protein